jgi:hypothetical protein
VRRANVELHIEELTLDGFDAIDRYGVAAAFESELARLLAEQGVPAGLEKGFERQHAGAADFQLAPDSTAETIGTEVARSLYGGFKL